MEWVPRVTGTRLSRLLGFDSLALLLAHQAHGCLMSEALVCSEEATSYYSTHRDDLRDDVCATIFWDTNRQEIGCTRRLGDEAFARRRHIAATAHGESMSSTICLPSIQPPSTASSLFAYCRPWTNRRCRDLQEGLHAQLPDAVTMYASYRLQLTDGQAVGLLARSNASNDNPDVFVLN